MRRCGGLPFACSCKAFSPRCRNQPGIDAKPFLLTAPLNDAQCRRDLLAGRSNEMLFINAYTGLPLAKPSSAEASRVIRALKRPPPTSNKHLGECGLWIFGNLDNRSREDIPHANVLRLGCCQCDIARPYAQAHLLT